jgi:hypothetical protein
VIYVRPEEKFSNKDGKSYFSEEEINKVPP